MRQLIGKRSEDHIGTTILGTPTKRRPPTDLFASRVAAFAAQSNGEEVAASAVDELVIEADETLGRSSANMDVLTIDLQQLATDSKSVSGTLFDSVESADGNGRRGLVNWRRSGSSF